jgi:glutaredoxin-like protein
VSNSSHTEITQLLAERLEAPVEIHLLVNNPPHGFLHTAAPTQQPKCCQATAHVLHELSDCTDKISVQVHQATDLAPNPLGMKWAPGLAVVGRQDFGIRHYGLPSGYDFALLLNTIVDVSAGTTALSAQTLDALQTIDYPIQLTVFVGESCPFCPIVSHFAIQMAIAHPLIRCETVNVGYFPTIAQHYHVQALPTVVINGNPTIFGLTTERIFLEKLLHAQRVGVR